MAAVHAHFQEYDKDFEYGSVLHALLCAVRSFIACSGTELPEVFIPAWAQAKHALLDVLNRCVKVRKHVPCL